MASKRGVPKHLLTTGMIQVSDGVYKATTYGRPYGCAGDVVGALLEWKAWDERMKRRRPGVVQDIIWEISIEMICLTVSKCFLQLGSSAAKIEGTYL